MSIKCRSLLTSAVLIVSLQVTQVWGAAAARFDLPAQPLNDSIKAVASQTNTNILFDPELVEGLRAPALAGQLTVKEAIQRLVAHLGISVEFLNEKTVVLGAASSAKKVTDTEGSSSGFVAPNIQPELTRVARAKAENSGVMPSPTTPASAQEGPDDRIGEITVTAQKRDERLIDVPISIVALSADELRKRNIASIDDLALAVPGLTVASSGSFQRRVMLRGISNIFGSSPLIGLYLDEASVTTGNAYSQQLDLRTYDLERVEVLRGPQGTLYGEGSIGGTVRFITRNPQLDRFAMNADLATLFTENGSPGQRVETMLNVPVVNDQFGLRIVGTFDHEGGWIDQQPAVRKDFNDQNLVNVRAKGLWQPVQQLTVSAMAMIHRNDGSVNQGETERGNFVQVLGLTTTPTARDDYDVYNLTVSYDFSGFRFLNTASYLNQDKLARHIGTRSQNAAPPAPPSDNYLDPSIQVSQVLTDELRFTSTGSAPWQWTVGAYYRHSHNDTDGAYPASSYTFASTNIYDSRAVFGDTSYRVSARWLLGAGLRYFQDDQDYFNGTHQSDRFQSTNPRFYLQYKVSDDLNVYASVAKGFRSGGFNGFGQPTYDPETVRTYELGTKMALLDGHVSADTALFYSDYTNYQIIANTQDAQNEFFFRNAGNADIKGIEWSFAWRLSAPWAVSLNGNYIDSKFYQINGLLSTHHVGDALDLIPKYGVTASVERVFDWNGHAGTARLDYSQQGRSTYTLGDFAGPWHVGKSDIINMLNLDASLQWSENFALGFFAQNLLNDRGMLDPFGIEGGAARSRPRTYGVKISASF